MFLRPVPVMIWVVALIYLGVHKTYLGGLFKNVQIPRFLSRIASAGLGCGLGITTLMDSIAGGSETSERECSVGWGSAIQCVWRRVDRQLFPAARNRRSATRDAG